MRAALQRSDKRSAAGEDGISYAVLDALSDRSLLVLCALFNACKRVGKVPQEWQSAVVRMLYKGSVHRNPQGTADTTKYRGISLSSCVGKLLEGVLHLRLEAFLAVVSPIHKCQGGFLRGHSALEQLWAFVDSLSMRGPNALVAFWDIRKAFPSVRRSSVLRAMYDKGVMGDVWRLVAAFFEANKSTVVVDGEAAAPYDVENGTREGARLSPIEFLCLIDEMLELVEQAGVGYSFDGVDGNKVWLGMLGFADDMEGNPRDVQDSQAMFGITGDWAWSHMIRYGLEKTGIAVFNPDPDLPSYPGRLELTQRAMVDKNGNESRAVPVLSMYEYLGLLLDEYGELAEHILQEVLPEVRRRLWARSSTIATHDILAPEASLRFIDSGVLSVA